MKLRKRVERRWTIIALRIIIFYFGPIYVELTWHECSFMSHITNYKVIHYEQKVFGPILGPFKIG